MSTISQPRQHPAQLAGTPRRLYLGGVFLQSSTAILAIVGVLMLLAPGLEIVALPLFAAALVAYPIGSRLRSKSWWFVSWRDQRTALEPLWIPLSVDIAVFVSIAALVVVMGLTFGQPGLLLAGTLVVYLAGGQWMLHAMVIRHPESSPRARRMNLFRSSVFGTGLVAIVLAARPGEQESVALWVLVYVSAMVFGIVVQYFTSGLRGAAASARKDVPVDE